MQNIVPIVYSIFQQDGTRHTWGSKLCSSCIAELCWGSRHVLVGEADGSITPDLWEGRGQRRRPLWGTQAVQE